MKIHLSQPNSPSFIQRYDASGLYIQGKAYQKSLLLYGDSLENVEANTLLNLSEETLQHWAQKHPQLLILGIGDTPVFLTPEDYEKLKPFWKNGIGFEVMTLHSAAKTYNVLIEEGRNVMALFLFPDVENLGNVIL